MFCSGVVSSFNVTAVQVGICPVKPAEFVIFNIGQWDGGGLIEE